jgi:hypothetical protein
MATLEATSVAEFVEIVTGLKPQADNAAFWFRGEASEGWELMPSMLRPPYDKASRPKERLLMNMFREHAPAYVTNVPEYWIDWQVLMQHHGCPTRLLDWTESALTALFFAVKSRDQKPSDGAGAVYVLEPGSLAALDEMSGRRTILTSQAMRLEDIELRGLEGKFTYPLPILPAYNTPRAHAQKSRFTLYPYKPSPIPHPVLQKIRIPFDAKKTMFWDLKTSGVTATTIYPDLDGLARELRVVASHGEDPSC